MLKQVAVRVEDVHQSSTRPSIGEAARTVREVISDIQPSTKALDVRGIIGTGKIRVQEPTRKCHLVEIVAKGIDGSRGEIRRIERETYAAHANGESRVDRSLRAV